MGGLGGGGGRGVGGVGCSRRLLLSVRRHASVYFFGLWANNLSICPLFPILVTLSLYMANFGETSLSYIVCRILYT